MRPIIGIIADVDSGGNTIVKDAYLRCIEDTGAVPVVLPTTKNRKTMEYFVDICDGFLFTGGGDVDPVYYGEAKKDTCGRIDLRRDKFELELFEVIMEHSKPILAICRGAQLVNVALGGTLYQDIPTELFTEIAHRQTQDTFSPSHKVFIKRDTPLYSLMDGEESMTANSFHHQAIKRLGRDLEIMATAKDGVIEAVYLTTDQYLMAYQWHPERLYDKDGQNRRIFSDFAKACKNKKI